jgi:uncharacterized membrane protein
MARTVARMTPHERHPPRVRPHPVLRRTIEARRLERDVIATLTVWRFPSALDADHAELTLKRLVEQDAIVVHDACFVTWPDGAKGPRTRVFRHEKARGALGGSGWGLLLGTVVGLPLLGAAVGAAAGAARADARQVSLGESLDEAARDRLRSRITPGTSAMFVVTSGAVRETVRRAFQGQRAELLYSSLSPEEEQELGGQAES